MKKIVAQTNKQSKSSYYETVKMNNFKESARLEGINVHSENFNPNKNLIVQSKRALIKKFSKLNSNHLSDR